MRIAVPRLVVILLLLVAGTPPLRAAEPDGLAALVEVLAAIDDPAVQRDLLAGMREALRGRKEAPLPKGWSALYPKLAKSTDPLVREHARVLALAFGDPAAMAELKKLALDAKAATADRLSAIEALADKRAADLPGVLQPLLADAAVRRAALRGLAAVAHADTAKLIVAGYARFSPEERTDALATLAARPETALALLAAVEAKQIPRGDISAFLARQLYALGNEQVSARLRAVWGEVRETSAEKQAKIAELKKVIAPAYVAKGNLASGRALFQKTCQQCHLLYGQGNRIGPDLTGSNRANLDYILGNVIDPSAEIAQDYRLWIMSLADGRVLTGLIVEREGKKLTLQTATERIILAQDDIEESRQSPLSMMPEGQFDKLTREEIRDLVAYLAGKEQVELPAGATGAEDAARK